MEKGEVLCRGGGGGGGGDNWPSEGDENDMGTGDEARMKEIQQDICKNYEDGLYQRRSQEKGRTKEGGRTQRRTKGPRKDQGKRRAKEGGRSEAIQLSICKDPGRKVWGGGGGGRGGGE